MNYYAANRIHLGKTDPGMPFLWNLHDGDWYHSLATLLSFLISNPIFDANDTPIEFKDFVSIAFTYARLFPLPNYSTIKDGVLCGKTDHIVDGLRVSESTSFS